MKSDLFVGDLHIQVNNLEDSKKLLEFVRATFVENDCGRLVLLGDIFHTHAVIRQEVAYLTLSFLKDFYYSVVGADRTRIVIIAGNHDGISPISTEQNSVDLILGEFATVISGHNHLVTSDGYVFVPFIHSQDKFLEVGNIGFNTAIRFNSNPVLVCHQTFDGAAYESGMLCPDGVKSDLLPYSVIISGHIHKRQVVNDKVLYLGTPRPITASEANDEKFIYKVRRTEDDKISLTPISTKQITKQYYYFDLNEGELDKIELELQQVNLDKDDVRIRVSGSEAFYEQTKEKYSKLNGKIKLIPNIKRDLSKKINLEASNMTIETALEKYTKEIADIDDSIRGDVWNTIAKML